MADSEIDECPQLPTCRFLRIGLTVVEAIDALSKVPGEGGDRVFGYYGFNALLSFCAREGHVLVQDDHVEVGFNLGSWVGVQRTAHSKGKLSADRVLRLESVHGWTWDWRESRWDQTFQLLLDYVDREGHANVPAKYVERATNLGAWVANQRASYRRGELRRETADLLEAVPGWTWKPSKGPRPRTSRAGLWAP